MDIAKIATLGTQIAEKGMKLASLREQRDALNTQIREEEQTLMPLVAEHSALIAQIAGVAIPSPVPAPVHHAPVPQPHQNPGSFAGPPADFSGGPSNVQLKNRVKAELKRLPPGMSAQEIADKLRVDGYIVREVMREEMERARRAPGNAPGEMEIVPDGT